MISLSKFLLKSDVLRVTRIVKNTGAKFFKDLKVGDAIEMSATVQQGSGATFVEILNLETGESISHSFNNAIRFLDLFEFEKVEGEIRGLGV